MPLNYANTTAIVDGQSIDAVDVKAPIDALDDQVKAMADAQYIVNAPSAALNAETTLAAALASPPAIGGTAAAAGTFTGLTVRGAAGTVRSLGWHTNNLIRFLFYLSPGAETGANVGSDLAIERYSDAGSFLGTAFSITRSNGAVTIPGTLSKGGGTFKIDHPLHPREKWLYHGFVEAPRYDLIYRGSVQMVNGQGAASIDAASNMETGTWQALTQNPQIFLQNRTGWARVRGSIVDGTLLIECEDAAATDTIDWLIVAERADVFIRSIDGVDSEGRMTPEQPKAEHEAGQRIHEEAWQKAEAGIAESGLSRPAPASVDHNDELMEGAG